MESLIGFFASLNSLSPLAVIALLALVLFYQAKNKKTMTEVTDNHLHGLPEMAETLQRIEVLLNREFGYIRARLNGHSKGDL